VEEIYDDAFYYCPKLIEVINHSSLDVTADSAWHGYVAASALKVHQGESEIVNVDGYLFYTYDGVNYLVGYIGDEADIVLPENYNGEKYEIYDYAFSKNSYIISVTINDGAVKMGDYAFSECKKLESVNIAGEITDIGEHAFYNTLSLKSVTISESVTHIGCYAFYLCNNLKSVVFENTDGWECSWYSGEEEPTKVSSVDLARPSNAVQYLVNMNLYCSAYWNRV
jgi:hypothetical protein